MAMREFKHPEKSILGRIERLEADVEGETKIFFDKENRNRVFDKISLLREVEAGLRERIEELKDCYEWLDSKCKNSALRELRRVLGEEGWGE